MNIKTLYPFVWLSILLINTACTTRTITTNDLPDFKSMVQAQYITPFKNGDAERWLQVFADDAVGMHNTLPAFVGKEAIGQFAAMVAENMNIEQMDVRVDEVRVNGSWALTRGSFTSRFVPKAVNDSSKILAQRGKFILLWEKQPDGVWQVILDMGNNSEPPQNAP